MLEISSLCYSAEGDEGRVDILKDVSLNVKKGSFVVITGPNGGGKTTLAKTIMGIVQPSSGSIKWDGEEISTMSVTDRARRGISYGFQQPPRFKGMLVSDLMNVAAGRELSRDECCQYLTRVGLCSNDYLSREVNASLSGGEVKRIEIATVLAKKGGLMIFDEPEAGIDLWSFARLTETFESIHRDSDATIIIISHQERIIRLADEIVMISGGRITKQGPVSEIFPQILANTKTGCSYMEEGAEKC